MASTCFIHKTVVSLGWVTPRAATEDVTPLFFPEKPGDLFCSSLSLSLSLFIAFTRVSPLSRVSPHTLFTCPTSFLHYFLYLPTKNFFLRVSPPGGCHPGRSAPPGTPLSQIIAYIMLCFQQFSPLDSVPYRLHCNVSQQQWQFVACMFGCVNNFQPLPAFVLIFIASVIRFCDGIYFDRIWFWC